MKKILFAASECVPFIKTGGLADVVGSLPKCFDKEKYDVRVMIPNYMCIDHKWKEKMTYVDHFYMDLCWRRQYVGIMEMEYEGVKFYFIDNEYYFSGERPYSDPRYDLEKFAFFSRAVLSALPVIDFRPDIIHCWGSELCYGLIAQYISIPVVMHIQGIINPIYQAFRPAGMDGFSILKASDYNLLKYYKLYCRANVVMKHQATRERDMLKHIKYFIGRTEWDRQVTRLMSPESTYYYCSEALRTHITNSPKWTCNSKRKLIISSTILPPLYKGADVILRTASILKTSYKGDFEWNIYGMNSIHLQEKFTGIKSGQVNVFCRGKVGPDILSEKLLKSDVFVHPSYIDNSPNSVCEAQYLGVPVIATYVGGIPSLIADGAGLLVPANDVYQTAWNIIRLKKDIDLAESISEKEITLAEKRHNLKTIVNDLLGVYEQIKRKNTDEI